MRGPRSLPPMPMLTTLRIRLPVWPVHAPDADPVGEARHPVEDAVHLRDDVVAVDLDALALRRPKRDVQDGAVLGDVDLLAREHRVAQLLDTGPARQRDEQPERLRGQPVLGVVEVQVADLEAHRVAARRVVGEEVTQVRVLELHLVLGEREPLRGVDDPLVVGVQHVTAPFRQ